MRIPVLVTFMALFIGAAALTTETSHENARECFERYVALEAACDPSVADLYADDAKIQNINIAPNGQKRVTTMAAPAYKEQIRQTMPAAKPRGDTSKYSELNLTKEGDRIRVTAVRFSELKRYSAPLSMLVGPDGNGVWRIYEELSESR